MTAAEHHAQSVAGAAYAQAGVSLDRGYEVVRRIRDDVAGTARPGVMGGIGGFGGMFDFAALGYREPVLVSGTDGVGTKLMLAFDTGIHTTIGIDAVAMCVNDVIAQGAQPLFFLDYLALPVAEPQLVADIVHGVARACKESNCALIGGETAEMNDLYAPGTYDIAGFCVAAVEKSEIITGEKTAPGDVLLGLASSGPHSNGYSLLRKIFFKDHDYDVDTRFTELGETALGQALLTPTKLYVRPVLALLDAGVDIHGMANITGGGFYENLVRINGDLGYEIKRGSWPILPIFDLVARLGELDEETMFNVFNMGIGYVIALPASEVERARQILAENDADSYVIGQVTESGGVSFV
ncbi:MAG: phosphoribosylformylglycinamidine cyclo-ligase [Actinomycetaceae bacterium]|nr:phosphoribosylformylglycinamidine cyclo-ligase [Actinomycetaceae bacterium]